MNAPLAETQPTKPIQQVVADDLEKLLHVLPLHVSDPVRKLERRSELLEVVLDLGREPEARLPGGEVLLSPNPITTQDLNYVIERIGAFGGDNRAGIERTLHRISAIRNREGTVVGITCRVGRSVFGTIAIIRDIVESGRSILMMGRPGVGKTTMLREAARVLADDLRKRVMIVDTSNEIGGDGDIPHPAVGRARRMQVPTPSAQHAVMIEAVENHMPEVIVIDEIGTELEASASRTIAERGVQLVATAHGNTLENLMLNPTLSDLVGGIQSVTLGDDEARRRGTQKSVLERKAPPTFEVIVEIQNWNHVAVHENVAEVVDSILRGQPLLPAVRRRGNDGEVVVEQPLPTVGRLGPAAVDRPVFGSGGGRSNGGPWNNGGGGVIVDEYGFEERRQAPSVRRRTPTASAPLIPRSDGEHAAPTRHAPQSAAPQEPAIRIYPFGVNRSRIEALAKSQGIRVNVVASQSEADAVLTVRNYYRRKPQALRDAEADGVPVHVLRSNSGANIGEALARIAHLELTPVPNGAETALKETQQAIAEVAATSRPIELSPQDSYIRRLQHQLAGEHNLDSKSTGHEPYRRVRLSKGN